MKELEFYRNKTAIVRKVGHAEHFVERIIGLMFKEEMEVSSGLYIDPCKSIHTFFMKFALDVAFLDSKNRVIKVIYNMKPWRVTRTYFTASAVLEVKAGLLPKDLIKGDELEVICTN